MTEFISNINFRFPFAALIILLIIGLLSVKKEKLPLSSARLFKQMFFIMCFNLLAEVGTLLCLYNFDSVPKLATDLVHIAFILSLCLMTWRFFIYIVHASTRRTIHKLPIMLVTLLPMASAVCVCFMGSIEYYVDDSFVYSYGSLPSCVYVCIGCYMVASAVYAIANRKKIDSSRLKNIFLAIGIWIFFAAIQLFEPRLLLSSLGGASLLYFVYLSLENPAEFFNTETRSFNKKAFNLITSEMLNNKKSFFVITLLAPGLSSVKSSFGQDRYNSFLASLSTYISKCYDNKRTAPVYHLENNALTLILNEESSQKVEELCKALETYFSTSWVVDGIECMLSPQVFAIECPAFAQNTDDISNAISFFASHPSYYDKFLVDDEFTQKRTRYIKIQSLLKKAIANKGFDVFYQPIYSTKTKTFTSAEALVRLSDTGDLGFVSPEEFIPIAEQDDSIMGLGRIVFEKVCELAAKKNLKKLGVEYIEVNLSGVQCMSPDLYSLLNGIMLENKIPPEFINLEITESTAITTTKALEQNMEKLCAIGCTFSLDDFGTGYSNLTQIIRYPFKIIKLDKSLVWGYYDENTPQIKTLTTHIINMINELGLEIVAEGVETKEMVDMLAQNKVEHLQGYYFSKPLPEAAYCEFLEKQDYNN